ncbi:MAG: hypothetical protein ABWZ77_05225 [Naasia sp.]
MAILPTNTNRRDFSISGDNIETVTTDVEYGWFSDYDGLVWESSGRVPYNRDLTTSVRRVRHTIIERIEVIDGPNKGTRW